MSLLASQGLSVAGAYRIEAHTLDRRKVRVVVADWKVTSAEDTWPVREPNLVEDFAKVTNEASLLKFNGRYGFLGYHNLHGTEMQRRNEPWQGDPVAWALAHAGTAAGILGAVDIINEVRSGRVKLNDHSIIDLLRALLSMFRRMSLESLVSTEPPKRWEGFAWTPPEAQVGREKFRLCKRFTANWKNDPIGTGYHVLSWVLNQYIRGVRFEFVSSGYVAHALGSEESEPRFGVELHWDCLLQVIYWRLAEKVGGAFRKCSRCGRVFPMSTGKDKFCSRRCSDAYRSKQYRDRKKEKVEAKEARKRQKKRQKRRKR